MKPHEELYSRACTSWEGQGRKRILPPFTPTSYFVDFSHNDYLNLSRHPVLIQAAQNAANQWGVGSRASRLVSGNLPLFEELEETIAKCHGQEAALIFASGFQANASVIAALLDPSVLGSQPLVFADKHIHASMHFGCRAVGVLPKRFRHNDLNHLEDLLKKAHTTPNPRFIMTESVFSMDGSKADIDALVVLCTRYNAFLYVDEAHALGVIGEHGYGLTSSFGRGIDLVMGTFSKALGSAGGYVACSAALKKYLLARSTGFMFSTAPSPPAIAAAHAAWHLVPTLHAARRHIAKQSLYLRAALQNKGFNTGASTTHIIPVIIGSEEATLGLKEKLLAREILVAAIRPPSVPSGSARLRIALNASHTDNLVYRLLEALST